MALNPIKPALQYSEGRSKPWSGAKVINCYAEKSDGDKKTEFALMAIPGLTRFVNLGTMPIRGAHTMGTDLFVVCGTTLYKVVEDGTITTIGTIAGYGTVRMVDNGRDLAIAAEPNGYVYRNDGINTDVVIPDGLPDVTDVGYIDSYFVWTIYNSDQCIYSGISDGLSYDALDVFTAEGSPDGLVGIMVDHREVQLYGEHTIELFYNAGGADNVFERQGNAFIERGCFDRFSIVKIDNSVHFMGDDRIIYRLDGYSPIRISTHAIEYKLHNATYARAYNYTQEGHKFYIVSTDVGTFGYDMATGAWHERRSWDKDNHRVGYATTAWGQTVMTDAYTGNIYYPDLDVFTEDGEAISVEIDLPTIGDGATRQTCYAFQVMMENGVGLSSGQGSDPQIMASYSKDGGRTYSNELWRTMGAVGQYLTRAVWRSWGQFWQLNIKLVMTDPVRRFVMGYKADIR